MSARPGIDMYGLLPALYRLQDAEQGLQLRAVLEIIGEQAGIVRHDIDALWDDYFIETCADWVVPYIGDLVANNPLYEVAGRRADVANTIYYRRRKGTLPMLEELARNVTGWGAHAVAFFESLGWTQNFNHLRYEMAPNPESRDPNSVERVGTANLRGVDALDRLDGPFDVTSHTVDVRPISHTEGWHNIRKVGFFLWRLRPYPLANVSPRQAAKPHDYGYHFSTLGNPAPLFTDPQREADETGLAREVHVPGPIRPAAFYFGPEDYYGSDRSVHIVKDGNPVPITDVICKDLRSWDQPPAGKVAVDVRLGRLAFPEGESPAEVQASYDYGFSADIGGGPYDRRRRPSLTDDPRPDTVADAEALDASIRVSSSSPGTINQALQEWENAARPRAVIQIEDSRTYDEDLTIDLHAGDVLVIQAKNRLRPTLIGRVTVTGAGQEASLTLNGLLIEGHVVIEGGLGELMIEHCTLVPGRGLTEEGGPREPTQPGVIAGDANDRLRSTIDHSIVGALRLPTAMAGLEVRDSIVGQPGGAKGAEVHPALLSKNLPVLDLGSDEPAVLVTIGTEGPYRAVLPLPAGQPRPATVSSVRPYLQTAIRDAHDESPAFRNTRVITVPDVDRFIVISGTTDTVFIEPAGADGTANELGFQPLSTRTANALIGGPLPSVFGLSSDDPAVVLTIGDEDSRRLDLREEGAITTVPQARDRLRWAIRAAANTSQAFDDTLVGNVDDRLIVLPGASGMTASFNTVPDDRTTLSELALGGEYPAISANDTGQRPGPPATLRRTTVFGGVHFKELTLASEVIFTAPVVARRRQAGCVRFSYVPEGSRTPRRYRCQPDAALARRSEELGLDSGDDLPPAEKMLIRASLRPSFTSTNYGDPGYAQLGFTAAREICTGAEDGSEMGAFSHLQQPQREANLRIRLEEYLPFGLEAGLIYVT
ncbi:MAG: hypothetical protein H0U55_04270 [Rubrobacteraceae bacterium]|nr:hypothetical protein [Rubrobacteraceae bacterium]